MEKLLYWIWKCIRGKSRFCRSFCVTCPHYEKYKNDGVLE